MGGSKESSDGQELSTLERLRKGREELAQRNAMQTEQRPEEDRIREEHHDAQATTIQGDEFVERRRFRSDVELRAQRDELQRQWESREQRPKRKPASRKKPKLS
jgi:hypothetical protein